MNRRCTGLVQEAISVLERKISQVFCSSLRQSTLQFKDSTKQNRKGPVSNNPYLSRPCQSILRENDETLRQTHRILHLLYALRTVIVIGREHHRSSSPFYTEPNTRNCMKGVGKMECCALESKRASDNSRFVSVAMTQQRRA